MPHGCRGDFELKRFTAYEALDLVDNQIPLPPMTILCVTRSMGREIHVGKLSKWARRRKWFLIEDVKDCADAPALQFSDQSLFVDERRSRHVHEERSIPEST